MKENDSRILIVDDNAKNIQIIGTILKQSGYQIIVAQNGEQAIRAACKIYPDLILLDIMMPEMDGFETCSRLKTLNQTRDTPVIFLTAKTETENIVKGLQLGAVDYISKPFNAIELLSRVKTHIELNRSRKLQGVIEMAGAVCHEMNQPLQSILGYAELMLIDVCLDHPLHDRLVRLIEQVDKLGKITKKMMRITRYEIRDYPNGKKIIDIDKAASRS